MTWGKIPKELKLELTVPGAPRRNERLSLLPIQCSVGKCHCKKKTKLYVRSIIPIESYSQQQQHHRSITDHGKQKNNNFVFAASLL
jgi:hypothetical protein